MKNALLGAVEAGGTKFRAAVISSDMTIVESVLIPTSDPDATLGAVAEFFVGAGPVAALGIASFGPVDLDPRSPGYGSIADTPKPLWSGVPILGRLSESLGVPADIQTDVEAAAVAEQVLGPEQPVSAANKSGKPEAELARPRPERPVSAAHDSRKPADSRLRRLAYVTVGTGIGAAVAVDGKPFRGRRHSELGHIPVRRVAGDDYPGHCPFHRDCLEGMACGPAMAERWGIDSSDMAGRDDIWRLEAAYLAQLVRVLVYSFAPDRIVLGGGVGGQPGLAEMIGAASRTDLGGYADYTAGDGGFVTAPALGNDSGLLGAALLARSLP